MTLHFERAPFMSQERTVWLPWNSFYAMDTLVMKTEENSIPSCDLSGFVRPDPIIISSPLSTFFSAAPAQNPIVPETQVRRAVPRASCPALLSPKPTGRPAYPIPSVCLTELEKLTYREGVKGRCMMEFMAMKMKL